MGEFPEINENDSQEQVKVKIALIDYRADCHERARKIGVISEAIPEKYSDSTRELKFRIWDSISQKYYDESDEPVLEFMHEQDGIVLDYNNYSDEIVYTIEQFTGLVDRNGEEIFEGDVLKLAGFRGVFRVRYVKAHAMFIAEQIENNYSNAKAVPFSDLSRDEMVIVANIHENGDLLK